ncbi:MAG: hypothetical protein ACI89U_001476 [Gammaproteobacteria bacterium]|jgi:hypothetical protein
MMFIPHWLLHRDWMVQPLYQKQWDVYQIKRSVVIIGSLVSANHRYAQSYEERKVKQTRRVSRQTYRQFNGY